METLVPIPQFVTRPTDSVASIERAVLASIADGVIVNDLAGNVILINQTACRLLRVDPQAVIEKPVRALFESFSTRARLTLIDALARLDHDPYSFGPGEGITETVIELGTLVIQAHLSPVLTEIGEFSGIVTILRDITREVEAERAKSEFVSNVSHELRTPLTSIVGYTNLLLGHAVGPLSEPQENFLGVIQTNANRLVTLINDLLDISRIEGGRLELDIRPVALEDVIHEVTDMIRPQCEQKKLRLNIEIEPNVGFVLGDRNRLVQIVANLASNAYRYTLSGGSITLSLVRSDTTARIAVSDTGIGISLEDQARIFQRFYRVSNASMFEAAGTGLGLSITKMLVEMHGGRMWVDSVVDQGSTFTFVLPLQTENSGDNPTPPPAPAAPAKTILVIEDDADLARQIGRQLRLEGVTVLTTSWGEEALQWVHHRPIDLITLDMTLPDIPGMEVLRRLKADQTTANIPVVIVSVIREQSGGSWGASDQVTRPFAVEKLIASIRQTLKLSPTAARA